MTDSNISSKADESQEIASKICSSCGFILPAHLDYFQKKKDCLYGVDSQCKKCMSIATRLYRQANKEKIALWQREYYLTKKEKKKKASKEGVWVECE